MIFFFKCIQVPRFLLHVQDLVDIVVVDDDDDDDDDASCC